MIGSRKIFLLSAALLWCVVMLAACHRAPDEERIRAAITATAQAAEAGSASGVGESLSEDFDGNAGELDRRRLMAMVGLLKLRGEHVGVLLGPVSVEPRGERMVATFTVTLSSGGRLLPDRLGVYRVTSGWREEGGDWHCYTANWERSI
ncbi:MAG: hypothetical protein WA930_13555 [Rhodanobacter sp.]|jgi:hypothetical protein